MEDKRKRYRITCPYCGKVQYACKSLFHEMGIEDAGHGTCLDCGGFMKLIYDRSADEMTAGIWVIRSKKVPRKGKGGDRK